MSNFITFICMSLNLSAAFIFGCTGETITEKVGHLNMGIPGIMCLGMCGAVVGANIYCTAGLNNGFLAYLLVFLFTILFSGLAGLLFSFFTVSLKCNQNVTGLTLTTFGVGANTFIVSSIGENGGYTTISKQYFLYLFGSEFANKNWFTQLFFGYGFMFYLAIAIAIITFIILKKTRIGLNLRACGENPSVADVAGINVTSYRYIATTIGSIIAGFGGAFLFLNHFKGALEYNISSYGWLSVALVIFTLWNPLIGIGGSFLFAMLYYAPSFFNFGQYGKLATAIPYVITIIVLIITSIFNKKENQAPASLGLCYFREDR